MWLIYFVLQSNTSLSGGNILYNRYRRTSNNDTLQKHSVSAIQPINFVETTEHNKTPTSVTTTKYNPNDESFIIYEPSIPQRNELFPEISVVAEINEDNKCKTVKSGENMKDESNSGNHIEQEGNSNDNYIINAFVNPNKPPTDSIPKRPVGNNLHNTYLPQSSTNTNDPISIREISHTESDYNVKHLIFTKLVCEFITKEILPFRKKYLSYTKNTKSILLRILGKKWEIFNTSCKSNIQALELYNKHISLIQKLYKLPRFNYVSNDHLHTFHRQCMFMEKHFAKIIIAIEKFENKYLNHVDKHIRNQFNASENCSQTILSIFKERLRRINLKLVNRFVEHRVMLCSMIIKIANFFDNPLQMN